MADGDFPDKYETHTTTTTTTSSSTVCTYNAAYVQSISGILRIAQIVVGLIYWITTAATTPCVYAQGFLIGVTIFAWIFTIIIFILFLFMLADRIGFINWPLTEFMNNIIWAIFHFVGVIFVIITLAKGCQFFGDWLLLFLSIGITLLYSFHAFLLFKDGVIVIRSQSSGATVQT